MRKKQIEMIRKGARRGLNFKFEGKLDFSQSMSEEELELKY